MNILYGETTENGHLFVVSYLVEQGANIHANNEEASRYASARAPAHK